MPTEASTACAGAKVDAGWGDGDDGLGELQRAVVKKDKRVIQLKTTFFLQSCSIRS